MDTSKTGSMTDGTSLKVDNYMDTFENSGLELRKPGKYDDELGERDMANLKKSFDNSDGRSMQMNRMKSEPLMINKPQKLSILSKLQKEGLFKN